MRNTNPSSVRKLLALAIPVLIPAAAFAEPLVLDAPAAEQTPPAATAPAAVNPLVDADLSHGKILVLPFASVNPNETSPWLGKSIQASLVSDLTVAAPGRVMSADQIAGTLDAAIAVGKQSGARFVVEGGFTTVDHDLRITGQVFDIDAGKPVAGLKATGDPSHLFQMEDGLALQIRGQLLGQHPIALPPMNEQTPVNAPAVQQSPNVATATPDAGVYAAPTVAQQPYYSPYAVAPTPPVYGSDYAAYTSYPGYYDMGSVSDYSPYYYDTSYCYPYSCYPYYGYGLGWCSPFGLGLGFSYGNGFNHHFDHFDRGLAGRNYALRGVSVGGGRASLGGGLGVSGSFRSSALSGRVSISPSFSRAATVRSSGVPYRSAAFYSRGSIGRTGGFSGGYHSSFSSHSFGGGSSHSGGGHGGGGHAGGGHR